MINLQLLLAGQGSRITLGASAPAGGFVSGTSGPIAPQAQIVSQSNGSLVTIDGDHGFNDYSSFNYWGGYPFLDYPAAGDGLEVQLQIISGTFELVGGFSAVNTWLSQARTSPIWKFTRTTVGNNFCTARLMYRGVGQTTIFTPTLDIPISMTKSS